MVDPPVLRSARPGIPTSEDAGEILDRDPAQLQVAGRILGARLQTRDEALAVGADATLIGRAFAYGLGAMGEAGVARALEIIRAELDVSMALCGIRNVKDASPAILRG